MRLRVRDHYGYTYVSQFDQDVVRLEWALRHIRLSADTWGNILEFLGDKFIDVLLESLIE